MSFAKLTKNAMAGIGANSSSSAFKVPTFNSGSTTFSDGGFDFKRLAMGLVAITVIVMLILIAVHYTITPIFKINRDGTGIIPVPGISRDDGEIYWKNSLAHGYLEETATILGMASGYTLQMDIYIDDVNAGSNTSNERPLFLRYNPTGTLTPIDYSVGVFLSPNINDMLVNLRTANGNTQTIMLKNVPPKTVIRVGIVVGDNYYEAYRDGELVGSRTFGNGIRAGASGRLWGSPGTTVPGSTPPPPPPPPAVNNTLNTIPGLFPDSNDTLAEAFTNLIENFTTAGATAGATAGTPINNAAAQLGNAITNVINSATQATPPAQCNIIQSSGTLGSVMNLHIWNRVLSPGEIKYASPAKPDASLFTK